MSSVSFCFASKAGCRSIYYDSLYYYSYYYSGDCRFSIVYGILFYLYEYYLYSYYYLYLFYDFNYFYFYYFLYFLIQGRSRREGRGTWWGRRCRCDSGARRDVGAYSLGDLTRAVLCVCERKDQYSL